MPDLVISGKTKQALEIAHHGETTGVRFPPPVGKTNGNGYRWTYTLPEPLYREMVYRLTRIVEDRASHPRVGSKHLRALRADLAKIPDLEEIVQDVGDAWRRSGRRYIQHLRDISADVDPSAEPIIAPPRGRNYVTIWCKCASPRPIRIAASRGAEGGITCNVCGHQFEP